RTNWPMASVGFVVTSAGELLAPSVSDLKSANFVVDNGAFFSNRLSAEVYWNNLGNNVTPVLPAADSDTASLNSQQAASVPNSWGNSSSANNSSTFRNTSNVYKSKAPSARNVIVQSPELV